MSPPDALRLAARATPASVTRKSATMTKERQRRNTARPTFSKRDERPGSCLPHLLSSATKPVGLRTRPAGGFSSNSPTELTAGQPSAPSTRHVRTGGHPSRPLPHWVGAPSRLRRRSEERRVG